MFPTHRRRNHSGRTKNETSITAHRCKQHPARQRPARNSYFIKSKQRQTTKMTTRIAYSTTVSTCKSLKVINNRPKRRMVPAEDSADQRTHYLLCVGLWGCDTFEFSGITSSARLLVSSRPKLTTLEFKPAG
jgi:hypothetical protein